MEEEDRRGHKFSQGWHRKSGYLSKLSQKTGINIVAGTGYYVESSHSQELVRTATVEAIAKHLTGEIVNGCVDDTNVKCGFIGEVGISDEMKGCVSSGCFCPFSKNSSKFLAKNSTLWRQLWVSRKKLKFL